MTGLPVPARFCPRCGAALVPGDPDRGQRPYCDEGHYTWYPDPKVGAGVVVEERGWILLVRRNHEPRMGEWAFPSGFVDAGEVVEEAAIREVYEEAGVTVRLDALLGVFSEPGNPVIFIAYAGSITDGTPQAGDEAHEVRLFDPADLPPLAFSHDDEIMTRWHEYRARRANGLPR